MSMHKISITNKWFSSIWVYRVLYHTEPVGKWFGSVSGYIFLYHTELNKESIANEKKKNMNTIQAKQIPIQDYLSSLGIKPVKIQGNNIWYYSPLRLENTPSFKVNPSINCWYDFGSEEKGNIIDLAMKLNHTTSVSEALTALGQVFPLSLGSSFSFRQHTPSTEGLSDVRIMALKHPALIQLIRDRRVDLNIALQYCKEVHYKVNGKNYFSIGFPNIAGGYETRNPFFKGCIPPKEISLFDHDTKSIHLFKGFMDYLSLLTINPKEQEISALILNSLSNLEKAIPLLAKHEKINSFLDNDVAGKGALNRLLRLNLLVENISERFSDFKDLNDFLCQKRILKEISTNSKRKIKLG